MSVTRGEAVARSSRQDVVLSVLAGGSGAMDVVSFVGLGGVFTSVMTGNLVLFGLGVGDGRGGIVVRTTCAVAAFAVGVLLAAGLAKRRRTPAPWAEQLRPALWTETVLLAGFTAGWQLAGAEPTGSTQVILIAVAAMAMGVRSGAISQLHLRGVSTTYLTGTLTSVLATPAPGEKDAHARRVALLASLLAGAILGGLLVEHLPRVAPVPVLAAPVVALIVARSDATR